MKKRIVSLILVAVMAVLALAGCAYSYEKDDMSKYVTFDKAAFFAALEDGTLKIEDADFGVDEAKRQEKVTDAIFAALAKAVGTDTKVTEGVVGKYDTLYYCYYATVTDDAGVEHVIYASKMTESSPVNFQLGLSTLEGLNLKIANAIKDKDVTEYIYSTVTADDASSSDIRENITKAGDTVYVSYTKEYATVVTDSETGEETASTEKITVTCAKVTLDGAEGSFLKKLEGLEIGKTNSFDITNNDLPTEDKTEKYTNVKVNWIVKNEKEICTVTDTPYTTSKEETDVYGNKVQLKDKELTYHIFPVYVIDVAEELTAAVVVEQFYSQLASHTDEEDGSKTYKFASVNSGNYKNGEKTLAALVDELAELRVELTDAEEALEDAEEALEKAGDKKTSEQEAAVTNAKTKLDEVQGKVDAKETEILAVTNTAGGDYIATALVADMRQYQYDTLLDSYKSTLKQSLADEVFAVAKKYMTFKTAEDTGYPILPKDAVWAAYQRIENGHKYNFYEGTYKDTSSSSTTGSSTSKNESNYAHYEGDYNEYLKAQYFTSNLSSITMQDVENKIGAEAEAAVTEVIRIYALADALEEKYSKDLSVTDEQIDEFKKTYLYYLFGSSMDESDYKPALVCDNVFNCILEETALDDYVEDTQYGNNKVQYLRIKYGFKD